MYTQCPHCQTCFRIAEDHLRIAGGMVRCGSCQEVFDATRHLFRNLSDRTPITDFQKAPRKPAPAPQTRKTAASPARPGPAPTQRTAAPPRPAAGAKPSAPSRQVPPPKPAATPSPATKSPEALRQERKQAPDQSRYMDSLVGNDRYNDLDKMGPIKIPGESSFGDSIIKFANEVEPTPSTPAQSRKPPVNDNARTPYEDLESRESPVSDADRTSLENFLAEVDAQLQDDGADKKSQLDKDIDDLLAFANELEDNRTRSRTGTPEKDMEDEFNFDAVAEFEKELDATDTGSFRRSQLNGAPQSEQSREVEEIEITPPEQEEKPADTPAQAKQTSVEEKPLTDSTRIRPPELPETDAIAEEEIPRALRRSLDMLENKPRRSIFMTLLMVLAILVLVGGLGLQFLLFRNVELVHMFPQYQDLIAQACDRLPCRYGGRIDVSQIKLLSRDVRSHPTQPNALLITATFVNQAPFDQPYPEIELTLYDLAGNVVASRVFTPREYLEKMYNRFLLMESGTPVQVTLAVLDPGKDAINFEFSFH